MGTPIASLLTRNLHEVFGEADAPRRRAAIAALFTEDARFLDHDAARMGHAALDQAVTELQARFPGWVFRERDTPRVVGEAGLLAWAYGPPGEAPRVTGQDVILTRDGRIQQLLVFLDPPQG
ncbi:nuclear transport factor 2 family protein [Rhodovarius crocodyli]|uniref:Nuclear transport factor 2 family protein n=1 Tax=Rhodovarius crocodyli TaxID=1979269 RepID=A0A437MGS6_9PROT|nr:nuclear transport factor 2 family protein [Rhodovarius crocodyli]RVT96860.1 nuclear transport factor 2 family protein [Rhodovarius crocodyli]